MNIRIVFSIVLALTGWSVHADVKSPNVVLIMADDLGYHDLGCYGHPQIKTPVLDRLAGEGVRLTGFHSGATVCTPSRMALLTGAYPARLGWRQGVVGYLMKRGTGLNPEALTMAEVFSQQGYRTGMAGKWHLGDARPFRPHRQGFDYACYINKSNNQTDELWIGDEVIEKPFENRRLTEVFTNKAIEFIRADEDAPFFLYLPYSAPHFPVEAHPDWEGKSALGAYGDVVEELDSRIGMILQVLRDRGVEDDTIVVFLSDNGPEPITPESLASPHRGRKWSALEGGTRVPCIVHYPGKIPGGRESDALIAAIDLLPTLSHACGLELANIYRARPRIDGVNVWSTLTGQSGEHLRNELLHWHGRHGYQAFRSGDWKLFARRQDAGIRGEPDSPALFNLSADVGENRDLSADHPEKVKELQQRAAELLGELETNRMDLGTAVRDDRE